MLNYIQETNEREPYNILVSLVRDAKGTSEDSEQAIERLEVIIDALFCHLSIEDRKTFFKLREIRTLFEDIEKSCVD